MALALVDIKSGLLPFQPEVMRELDAAHYCRLNRTDFRRLVADGLIPARVHAYKQHRIYLRSDIDAYLKALPPVKLIGGNSLAKKGKSA